MKVNDRLSLVKSV